MRSLTDKQCSVGTCSGCNQLNQNQMWCLIQRQYHIYCLTLSGINMDSCFSQQGLKLLFTHTASHLKSLFDQHTHRNITASICLQTSVITSRQHLWVLLLALGGNSCDTISNTISLPIDMKVSLFCILSVLFGLRAVYVFAAVWVIAFWISSSDKQTQLFRCSYARFIIQSQIVVFGLLASCKWHLQDECDWKLHLWPWLTLWNTFSSQKLPQPPATVRGRLVTDSPAPQRFQSSICICLHHSVMMRSRTLRQRRWGMSS